MTISTAPWAAIYSDIWTSKKLRDLRRDLGISAELAVGHLLRLWHACLTSAPMSGELSGWSAIDLADSSGWPEADAQRWTDALMASGWIHAKDGGGFVLHEWAGYGGQFLKSREDARLRKAKSRNGGHSDVPVTSQAKPDPVPVTSRSTDLTDLTDRTIPNQTKPDPTPAEQPDQGHHQNVAAILAGRADRESIRWDSPKGKKIAHICLVAWAERFRMDINRVRMTTARTEIWKGWAAEGRTASQCLKAMLGMSFDPSPADRDKFNDWQHVNGNFELFARLYDENEGKKKPRWPSPLPAAPTRIGPGREAVTNGAA